MNASPTPQAKLDAAFDNYFELSDVLRSDLVALLDAESDSQQWRRNFIRVAASLIEGYTHCLSDMCKVSFECEAPTISEKQAEAIRSERKFGAAERLKLTLSAAHTIFELAPAPSFRGKQWQSAKSVFAKRNLLMHPKTAVDLEISDASWSTLRDGVTWLVEQVFGFFSALLAKHGEQSSASATSDPK